MTILVFGRTGQVSIELSQLPDVECVGRDVADLSNPAACAEVIKQHQPRAVINAAAYTAVDKAEADVDAAMVVNGDAPGAMAQACADLGIPFVHISTDYVFDGAGETPWTPDDAVSPQNVYGRSKRKGEVAVSAAGGTYAILRTSWVFSAHGANFLKTMLRLGAQRDALSIVSDQIGGPTPAGAIAAACHTMALQLIETPQKSGIYHFSGTPECSWAEFADAIFDAAGIVCDVTGIPTRDYPTPAARPLNSRLDCSGLAATFGVERPDWRRAMTDILAQLELDTND